MSEIEEFGVSHLILALRFAAYNPIDDNLCKRLLLKAALELERLTQSKAMQHAIDAVRNMSDEDGIVPEGENE